MWSAIPAQERPVRNVPTAGFDCAKIMRKPVARVSRFSVRPAVSYTEGSTRSQHTENVESEKELKTLAELRLPQPSRQAVACPSCSGRPHILRLNTPDGCPSPLLFFNCTTP